MVRLSFFCSKNFDIERTFELVIGIRRRRRRSRRSKWNISCWQGNALNPIGLWPLKRSSSSQKATAAQEDQNNKEMLSQKTKQISFADCVCAVCCCWPDASRRYRKVSVYLSLLLPCQTTNTKNSLTENKNLKKNFSRFSAAASSVPSARPVDQERFDGPVCYFSLFRGIAWGGTQTD